MGKQVLEFHSPGGEFSKKTSNFFLFVCFVCPFFFQGKTGEFFFTPGHDKFFWPKFARFILPFLFVLLFVPPTALGSRKFMIGAGMSEHQHNQTIRESSLKKKGLFGALFCIAKMQRKHIARLSTGFAATGWGIGMAGCTRSSGGVPRSYHQSALSRDFGFLTHILALL